MPADVVVAYRAARRARPIRTGARDWVASQLTTAVFMLASPEYRAFANEALDIGLRELARKQRREDAHGAKGALR